MFKSKPSEEDAGLDAAINKLLEEMNGEPSYSEEYAKMVKQLIKLYSLKKKTSTQRVSPDTLITVAGNLIGILVIVGHERAHVVTSKALNFVMKATR